MPSWRDELIEAAKTKAERDAEEAARQKKRVEEALSAAAAALDAGGNAMTFAIEQLRSKVPEAELLVAGDRKELKIPRSAEENGTVIRHELRLLLELSRETAILQVTFGDAKPRDFDFAKDRHIAAADVEEYVGRRAVELVRAAQKVAPW